MVGTGLVTGVESCRFSYQRRHLRCMAGVSSFGSTVGGVRWFTRILGLAYCAGPGSLIVISNEVV